MSDADETIPDTAQDAPPPEASPQAAPPPDAPPTDDTAYQAAGKRSLWGYGFFIGLLLLISAWLWWEVEKESTWVLKVWLVAGLWLFGAPLLLHAVDVFETITSRRGRASGMVLLTLVLGFGVLVGVSYVAHNELEQRIPSIDTTESGRYTLGEETRTLLGELDGTVYATYLARAGAGSETVQRGLRGEVNEQLRTFAASSPNVVYRLIDPMREPSQAKTYLASVGVSRVAAQEDEDVVVFSFAKQGQEAQLGKHKELRIDPYAFRRTSSVGETKWLGEKLVTESIYELVYRTYRAYVTGGHGETKVAESMRALRDALQSQNIQAADAPLDLRTQSAVPEDCDVLVVLDPATPFQPEEEDRILSFLDTGGAVFLCTDVADSRRALGLDRVLDRFGMYARTNYLVLAPTITASGPTTQVFDHEPVLRILGSAYADHPIVRSLRDRGFGTVFFHASYIEIEEQPIDGLEVEPLIWAPSIPGHPQGLPFGMLQEAGRTDFSTPIEGKDKTGSRLVVAAAGTRAVATRPGEPEKSARLVYFADTDVFNDRVASQVPTNIDLGVAALQWCIRRENLISVGERTVERRIVELTPHDVRVARYWPLGVALLALVLGGFVWWIRRR